MGKRIVIYAGAPESNALDWSSPQLLSDFETSIAQFAGLARPPGSGPGTIPATPSPSASSHAVWRSLSLEKAPLHTGFTQQYAAEFFTTSFHNYNDNDNDDDDEDTTDDLSHFYEESYVAHQPLPHTSQLVAAEESQFTTTTSFSTDGNTTSFISNASIKPPLLTTGAGSH